MNKIIEKDKKIHQTKYVEYLLEHPYLISDPKNYYGNLRLIAIYLKQVRGLKPKQREKFIYEFVEANDPKYNKVIDYLTIDKALRAANTGKLKDVKEIKIYRKEFEYINNLPLEANRKRVIFSAFCAYKYRNAQNPEYEGNPYIPENIISMSKLKSTSNVKDNIKYYLNELKGKYFDWTPFRNGSIILPFIKDMPELQEDQDYIVIDSLNNLYLCYDYFSGDQSIGFCKKCNSPFRDKNYKKRGARQLYCRDCTETEIKNKSEYKVILCENCGEKKVIKSTANRKLNLCDECYKKYRNGTKRSKSNSDSHQ